MESETENGFLSSSLSNNQPLIISSRKRMREREEEREHKDFCSLVFVILWSL